MSAILSKEWLQRAATQVEGDPKFNCVAEEFEATVLFGIDDREVAAAFSDGRMEVLGDPTYETWDFAVRGPAETWQKMLAETPPPLHHDLVGAWLQADLTVEGDLRMAIRHLRPLKRLFEGFREVDA